MYAIIKSGGKQYKVAEGDKVVLDHLSAVDEGADITFDEVLLIASDSETKLGAPTIEGAAVSAKVLAHGLGKKVITFKYRRRHRTRRRVGFRHTHTTVEITGIKG